MRREAVFIFLVVLFESLYLYIGFCFCLSDVLCCFVCLFIFIFISVQYHPLLLLCLSVVVQMFEIIYFYSFVCLLVCVRLYILV